MTISEKLAFEFIKEHDCFQFDTAVDKAKMTSYDIDKAFFVVGNIEIYPFSRDPGYHTVYVILPSVLNPASATLNDMLKTVQTKNLDATDIASPLYQTWQVTANRLKVLEQMLKNSGLIVTKCKEYSFDQERITKEDKDGKAIMPLTQNALSDLKGVTINGQNYYSAEEIEKLCAWADEQYSAIVRQRDACYDNLDPKTVEAHCKMMELSKELTNTSLNTINTLIDKLIIALKTN